MPIFSFNDEGAPQAGSLSKRGTLSSRQLAAFLSPRKTALRRQQCQRHSSFLFRFRLFRLFSFTVGPSLPFRHNTLPYSGVNLHKFHMGGAISNFAPQIRKDQSLPAAAQAILCSIRIRPRSRPRLRRLRATLAASAAKPTAATSPAHFFEKALLEFEPSARSTACLGRKHRKARACALTPWWRKADSNPRSPP